MATMTHGIGWFEIGTDAPEPVEQFYGTLFGWQFASSPTSGPTYRVITTPAKDSIQGGLYRADERQPKSAIFCVEVADVEATCTAAREAGGTVLIEPQTTPDGLVFADLLDPAGNLFGIYTPPAGS